MDESQYRWTLQNRWTYQPRTLFGSRADAAVLRDAAHAVRMQKRVMRALEALLPEDQHRWVSIHGVTEDAVRLQVSDSVVGEQLRTQLKRLQRDLSARVAGLRRISLQVSGTSEERE